MIPRVEQFTGCLIGQCLGDALGAPVEIQPAEVCRAYVATLDRARPGIGRPPFAFGQYTDDSQLARELLESFVACERFDPQQYARRIAAIFVEERIVGRGRATEAAARRLAAGVPWERSGTPAPTAGNGSAMRAGPVGLLCGSDDKALVAMAHDQGRITHADPRCSAGAVAIAGAVGLALDDKPIDPPVFLDRLARLTEPFEPTTAAGLRALVAWLALAPEEAAPPIAAYGRPADDKHPGISPFVTGSVLWSLYAFLRTPDDYWTTIQTAIAVGGDVDTTAAMAGAVSGARNGLTALPRALTAELNDRGTWREADLIDLATRAHTIKYRR